MQSILKFCKGLPEVTFEPGQTLLDEQGRDGVLYVLIEGAVEVVKGNLVVCQIAEPGAIFGELAVLLDVPHTASVRALTRCRVYRVQEANKFLRGNQDLTFLLARLLAQRLTSITGYLVDLKTQYEDHANHLGMVDEVLETLVHQQDEPFEAGSDRDPDTY